MSIVTPVAGTAMRLSVNNIVDVSYILRLLWKKSGTERD